MDAHRFRLWKQVLYYDCYMDLQRHLAQKWEEMLHPATSSRINNLSSMDLFVLFDLLGTPDPRIPSYFPTTHWAYTAMRRIENQLRTQGLAESGSRGNWFIEGEMFNNEIYKGGVEDDHLPFLHRGVEILHIIPVCHFIAQLTVDPFSKSMA